MKRSKGFNDRVWTQEKVIQFLIDHKGVYLVKQAQLTITEGKKKKANNIRDLLADLK